jgi:hypothetical protein
MGILSNLRRLTLVTAWHIGLDPHANRMWNSIVDTLKNPAIVIGLEQLNLVLKVRLPPSGFLLPEYTWNTLDVVLGEQYCPELRSVNIYLETTMGPYPMAQQDEVLLLVGQQLPFLYSRGILFAKPCRGFDWRSLLDVPCKLLACRLLVKVDYQPRLL